MFTFGDLRTAKMDVWHPDVVSGRVEQLEYRCEVGRSVHGDGVLCGFLCCIGLPALGGSAGCEGWRQIPMHESVDNAALLRGNVMSMVTCLVRVQGISQTRTLFELRAMDNVHECLVKVQEKEI